MAERLRDGMDRVLENQNVAGYVYGEASTFHIYLRAPGHDAVAARGHLVTFDSAVLKGMPASLINALREGFRSRGVELMSYNGGLTSAAHTEEDIDETVAAFEDLVHELVRHEQVATLG
jgi:glutamate-1-semialdehyde 2,1-aminomutase